MAFIKEEFSNNEKEQQDRQFTKTGQMAVTHSELLSKDMQGCNCYDKNE